MLAAATVGRLLRGTISTATTASASASITVPAVSRDHAAQADSTVADDSDDLAGADPGCDGGVVPQYDWIPPGQE
jgi:hypothetical protein